MGTTLPTSGLESTVTETTRRDAVAVGHRATLTYAAAAALAVVLVGFVAYSRRDNVLPDGLLQANGRVEGDAVTVASKFPGRIERLAAREGQTLRKGDLIAVLDGDQADARVAQASARIGEAVGALARVQARVREAEATVSAADARVRAAHTALGVLEREVAIRIQQAEAGLVGARAVLTRAERAEAQAERDHERFKLLAVEGVVEVRRAEQAELDLAAARSDRAAATSQVTASEQQLNDAQLGPARIRAQKDEVLALEAQRSLTQAAVEQARAALVEAQAVTQSAEAAHRETASARADLTIAAPIDGIVMTRTSEEGEVVTAGSPLLSLIDLDRLYLRVFVPEVEIGRIRLGLRAQVYADAFPHEPFAATVQQISSRAEFTPREVQTPDERVKLVYAVKLYLDANPHHRLTPGLPADAIIRLEEGVPWSRPRW